MININFAVIVKNKFYIAAAAAIAAFFVIAYINNRKAPSGGIDALNDREVQSREAASTSQGNIGVTEGDGKVAPLVETEIGGGTVNAETVSAPAPALATTPAVNPAPAKALVKIDPANAAIRDEQRQTDIRALAAAQQIWYTDHKHFYTCGAAGGDCGGKKNNLPLMIGNRKLNGSDPINSGSVCGRDYIYCGLDNTGTSSQFCYYAKLEGGGYYAASANGSSKRSAAPPNLADCSELPAASSKRAEETLPATPQERDAQRKAAMLQLYLAQSKWHGSQSQYYTCGASGGDCGGKPNGYPASIGSFLAKTPVDPVNAGGVCGAGLIYCGLDNIRASEKFCYYAKLEGGGYYTASAAGNFERSTPPATFGECS
jgi:hypothetical protein